MTKFLVRRLGVGVLVLFLLSLFVLAMVLSIAGDRALTYLDVRYTAPAQLAAIRDRLGFDRPWNTRWTVQLAG